MIKKQADGLKDRWEDVQSRQDVLVEWGSSLASPVYEDLNTFGKKSTAIQLDASQILTGLGRLESEYLSLRGRLRLN